MTEKVKRPRLMVLNEPDGRRFSRALALEIGRDHAEVFLQIEYLISISTTPMERERLWTRESVARLQDNHFPYWGKTFIAKVLNELVDGYEHTRYTFEGEGRSRKRIAEKVHIDSLLDKGWFNWGGDTTTWYSLNLEGISKLVSVQMDSDAFAVAASRKRVTPKTETGFPSSGNPLPQERKPVPSHAGDFNTETPTETPTEGGAAVPAEYIPEPPPNFPLGSDAFHSEKSQELKKPNTNLAIRIYKEKDQRAADIAAFMES
jgi:hypothetical protein